MLNKLEEIIDSLDMSLPFVKATWAIVKQKCKTETGAKDEIEAINKLEKEAKDESIDQLPFYTIYKSYAILCTTINDSKVKALAEAKLALQGFRVYENESYLNEAVAQLFLGLIYRECGYEQRAEAEIKKACKKLQLQATMYPVDRYKERLDCEKLIQLYSG
jgi:hypothetical protein